MADTPPQVPSGPMGQYYLLDKIAQGGMAEIYKGLAYDLHGIRRTVVIKKILPHVAVHREFIDMLVTEAKLAVQLTHGNIAQVYDLGKVGDDYFMVMEYVDGKTVSQIMRKAAQQNDPLPIALALHIAAEAASGLHYMHSRADAGGKPLNIIHRDISPQNLMLTSGGTVKIIDFGIAKAATTIEVTDAGVVKGKFAYMSPEQASGDPLDFRSDIFSLGVVLFEMLTGRRLFKGKDNQETLRNVRRANVPQPSLYRPEIPPELDEILLKALTQDREDRHPSAAALRDALVKLRHQIAPGFHPADIERYLGTLFKGDDTTEAAEESHTPLLIIDRTQSAILTSDSAERDAAPDTDVVPEASAVDHFGNDHSEWTPLLHVPTHRRRRQTLVVSGIAATLCALIALGLGLWRSHRLSTQPVVVQSAAQRLPGPELPAAPVTIPSLPVARPQPKEPFGDIVITSDPAGAEIFLDDTPTGLKTPATLFRLPADTQHLVGIHHKGRKFWSSPVSIRAGGIERLNARLEVDYASLEIVSNPIGADVRINGQFVGKTPIHRDGLTPGEVLQIEVSKEGFETWKSGIRTEAGHLSTLHPALERDPHAVPKENAPPVSGEAPPTVLPSIQ